MNICNSVINSYYDMRVFYDILFLIHVYKNSSNSYILVLIPWKTCCKEDKNI
jgi:hypothetical protein